MIAKSPSKNFYGGPIHNLYIIRHSDCVNSLSFSTIEFIKNNFNDLRNYRGFKQHLPLKKLVEVKNTSTIELNEFKAGDAILLIGLGRIIDQPSYNLANKCFEYGIPVFFIRSNSSCCNFEFSRRQDTDDILVTKTKNSKTFHMAPEKYFMEISVDSKLQRCQSGRSDALYALLPGSVPNNMN